MVFSPYDYNELERQRREGVEERLREGSPIVGVSFDSGLALLTVRQTQRKVFEIYDRMIYSAIGHQADVEAIRIGSINFAHQEGYERSPDDVTAQRLVGFQLSPPLKRLFGDQFNAPAIVRAIFGELGRTADDDAFYMLNYDGDFSQTRRSAVVAGTPEAEERMVRRLEGLTAQTNRQDALERALRAWGVGAMEIRRRVMARDDEDEPNPLQDLDEEEQLAGALREQLKGGQVEVGILDRGTAREGKFRLLTDGELQSLVKDYQ